MPSDAQIEANRRNAQNSTGPKTQEGKERARRNALRHGLAAEHILLIDEDAADFTEFAAGMRRALGPVGEAELVLADRIVMANWRLRRVWRQEAAALNAEAIHIAHGHARDELYERILAGLKEDPPEQLPDREMPWQPPHTLSSIARTMVNGMSDAQVEEAVTSKERAGADPAPDAASPPERKPQKPDTPIWPEARMAALSRYEGAIERALHRASTALEKLQARRREAASLTPTSPQPSPPSRAEREGPAKREGEVGVAPLDVELPLSRQRRRAAERAPAPVTNAAERTQFAEAPTPAQTPSERANGSSPPA